MSLCFLICFIIIFIYFLSDNTFSESITKDPCKSGSVGFNAFIIPTVYFSMHVSIQPTSPVCLYVFCLVVKRLVSPRWSMYIRGQCGLMFPRCLLTFVPEYLLHHSGIDSTSLAALRPRYWKKMKLPAVWMWHRVIEERKSIHTNPILHFNSPRFLFIHIFRCWSRMIACIFWRDRSHFKV